MSEKKAVDERMAGDILESLMEEDYHETPTRPELEPPPSRPLTIEEVIAEVRAWRNERTLDREAMRGLANEVARLRERLPEMADAHGGRIKELERESERVRAGK